MKNFSEEHIVGIPEIDEQHKKLFSIISSIYRDIGEYDGKNIDRHLIDLIAYSNYHLKTENHYLNQFIEQWISKDKPLCDGAREHIEEHKKFPEFIMEQIEKYAINREENAKPSFLVEIAIFLNKWVDNHILKHDKILFEKLLCNESK